MAGIVWHVIEGKYSKFIGPGYEEYVDDDYQIAKKKILEENVGNDNYNKLIYYFKMYEATVNILTKLLSWQIKIYILNLIRQKQQAENRDGKRLHSGIRL